MSVSDAKPDIVPRDLRFGILENAEPHWLGGDAVMSAITDGFAVMLPAGERFFIRSLRHYGRDIDDPAIREEIQGYAVQEAYHTREHEAYNDALRSLGVDADAMEASIGRHLAGFKTPILRLAATCAIEQITYTFSRFALLNPALMERASPAYRRLWRWHALEEIEHASVALSVYRVAPWSGPRWKKYLLRVTVLNIVLAGFVSETLRNAASILRGQRGRVGLRARLRMAWVLLVWPGFLPMGIRPYLAYLRPGYRGGGGPVQDARLVALGRRHLVEDLGPEAAGGAARAGQPAVA